MFDRLYARSRYAHHQCTYCCGYITAAWSGNEIENTEQAAKYCRAVYGAGFAPVCPLLTLPLYLNNAIPQEHKDGIDIGRELLRRSHVLVVCCHTVDEAMKTT